MATIQIADNDARVQYTQAINGIDNDPSPAATELTIDFPFFDFDNINVIKTTAAGIDTVLSRGTGTGTFTVTGTSVDDGYSGGNVKLHDSSADATVTYTIFRDIPVQRTTDFPTSGPFNISSLNTELDKIIAIEQELDTKITRTLQLSDSDTTVDLKLPNLNTRKGTTLAFNATTGIPEAGPSVSGVTTVSALAADIATLADIEDGTVSTDAISNTAAIAGNVTTVANISGDVTTVAGVASTITTNLTAIQNAADNATDAQKLAINAEDSQYTLSDGVTTGYSALHWAAKAEDAKNAAETALDTFDDRFIGVAASDPTVDNDGDPLLDGAIYFDTTLNLMKVYDLGNTTWYQLTLTSANQAFVNTVAGEISPTNNISTVAGLASQISDVASDAVDIGLVAGQISPTNNISTIASVSSDITTCANNLSGITSFANIYRIDSSDPSTSLDAGDLCYNTTSNNLKYYNGSEWVIATTSVNGTANRYSYVATSGQTSFNATYDVGYVDVYLNGVKLVNTTDFTATNGTSIVLTSGAALNDTVDIVGYGVFVAADTVSASSGGTFNGPVTVNNKLDIEEVLEKVTIDTSTTGTLTFDTSSQAVIYVTADQAADRTIDFTNVNSSLSVGQSITCAVLMTQGTTAYYLNAYQVDGGAVTPKWQAASAPTGGNASGIDVYSFTIIKTADATFTVLGSQSQFA